MIYNLLDARIIISEFHVETNAVCLYISEFNNKHNRINKKCKYVIRSIMGDRYIFAYQSYVTDHKTAKCIINYPLGVPCEFEVKLGRIDELVDQICNKYREIYSEPDKWKIWGHVIEDLQLWGILLNTTTNTISLGVDS